MFPIGDASRRPTSPPIVTLLIIVANVVVFLLELAGGDAFIEQWSVIPANISAGQHLIPVLTAMFMHAGWAHILGNMVFFWALKFGDPNKRTDAPARPFVCLTDEIAYHWGYT